MRYLFVLLFVILAIQPVLSQSDEIIIGVDSEDVIIYDIEDIHLKAEENSSDTVRFDLNGDGITDIEFVVIHEIIKDSFEKTLDYKNVIINLGENTYISYFEPKYFWGPCESLHLSEYGFGEVPKPYALINVFSSENDSTFFISSDWILITGVSKLYSPDFCKIDYKLTDWIGREGYVAFKMLINNNFFLGWFKIEVLDFNELIIKEYAYLTKEWGYGLFINEIMASNKSTIKDEFEEYDDWIEIYNSSNDSIWLGYFYMTDNLMWPNYWQMPDTIIGPGGFLLIWADNQPEQGKCHANFKLDKDGEVVGIFDSNPDQIDAYTFGEQTSDISIGRKSDGGDEWISFTSPTPGASNETLGIPETGNTEMISVSPNPSSGSYVRLSEPCNFKVYDILGKMVAEKENMQRIDISRFHQGVYFIVIDNGQKLKMIIQ